MTQFGLTLTWLIVAGTLFSPTILSLAMTAFFPQVTGDTTEALWQAIPSIITDTSSALLVGRQLSQKVMAAGSNIMDSLWLISIGILLLPSLWQLWQGSNSRGLSCQHFFLVFGKFLLKPGIKVEILNEEKENMSTTNFDSSDGNCVSQHIPDITWTITMHFDP